MPSWRESNCSRLASSLQAKHPGAAASLREGLEETLTVQALGITGALYRTLRTTNPIENLNGSVARYCRNVKRWDDGQMVLRWVASALSDAASRMRKLRGCSQMRNSPEGLGCAARSDTNNGARPQGRVACPTKEPSPLTVQQRAGHRPPRQRFTVIFTVNLSGTSIGAGFRAIRPKVTFRDLSRSIDSWGTRERFIEPRRDPRMSTRLKCINDRK